MSTHRSEDLTEDALEQRLRAYCPDALQSARLAALHEGAGHRAVRLGRGVRTSALVLGPLALVLSLSAGFAHGWTAEPAAQRLAALELPLDW